MQWNPGKVRWGEPSAAGPKTDRERPTWGRISGSVSRQYISHPGQLHYSLPYHVSYTGNVVCMRGCITH